jgi:hypothetical protein
LLNVPKSAGAIATPHGAFREPPARHAANEVARFVVRVHDAQTRSGDFLARLLIDLRIGDVERAGEVLDVERRLPGGQLGSSNPTPRIGLNAGAVPWKASIVPAAKFAA